MENLQHFLCFAPPDDGDYGNEEIPDKDEVGTEFFTGDLIMRHSPFVKCLLNITLQTHCYRCFEPSEAPTVCEECKVARYCCLSCKVFDSRDMHTIECNLWRQSPEFLRYCTEHSRDGNARLLLLRMYAMLKLQPDLAEEPWTSRYCRSKTFNDVLQRKEVVSVTKNVVDMCDVMARMMNATMPSLEVTSEALAKLAGVVVAKHIAIYDKLGVHQVGWGIYIIPALMEHGCAPTSILISRGPELEVRAITDILRRISPRITYINGHHDRESRWLLLKSWYGMEYCHCKRCMGGADYDVCFGQLKHALKEMEVAWKAPPTEPLDWAVISDGHFYIRESFLLMYEEHDPRVTEHYLKMMDIAMKIDLDRKKALPLYYDTKDHVTKTYGVDHPTYVAFVKGTDKFFKEYDDAIDRERRLQLERYMYYRVGDDASCYSGLHVRLQ